MTMEDLYQDMKDALKMFDLHFGDKEEVQIELTKDGLTFRHGRKSVTVDLPKGE